MKFLIFMQIFHDYNRNYATYQEIVLSKFVDFLWRIVFLLFNFFNISYSFTGKRNLLRAFFLDPEPVCQKVIKSDYFFKSHRDQRRQRRQWQQQWRRWQTENEVKSIFFNQGVQKHQDSMKSAINKSLNNPACPLYSRWARRSHNVCVLTEHLDTKSNSLVCRPYPCKRVSPEGDLYFPSYSRNQYGRQQKNNKQERELRTEILIEPTAYGGRFFRSQPTRSDKDHQHRLQQLSYHGWRKDDWAICKEEKPQLRPEKKSQPSATLEKYTRILTRGLG